MSINLLNRKNSVFFEQIARDVYAERDSNLFESPDGIVIEKTPTSIAVYSEEHPRGGRAMARLENGNLVLTRDKQVSERVIWLLLCIVFSFVVDFFGPILVFVALDGIVVVVFTRICEFFSDVINIIKKVNLLFKKA